MLSDVLVSLVSPLYPLSLSLSLSLSPFYNRWEITGENGALNFPHFVTPDHRSRSSLAALTGQAAFGQPGQPAPLAAAIEKQRMESKSDQTLLLLNRFISPLACPGKGASLEVPPHFPLRLQEVGKCSR